MMFSAPYLSASHLRERSKNSACCSLLADFHHSGLAVMTYSTHSTASLRRFSGSRSRSLPIAASVDVAAMCSLSGVRLASALGVSRSLKACFRDAATLPIFASFLHRMIAYAAMPCPPFGVQHRAIRAVQAVPPAGHLKSKCTH